MLLKREKENILKQETGKSKSTKCIKINEKFEHSITIKNLIRTTTTTTTRKNLFKLRQKSKSETNLFSMLNLIDLSSMSRCNMCLVRISSSIKNECNCYCCSYCSNCKNVKFFHHFRKNSNFEKSNKSNLAQFKLNISLGDKLIANFCLIIFIITLSYLYNFPSN